MFKVYVEFDFVIVVILFDVEMSDKKLLGEFIISVFDFYLVEMFWDCYEFCVGDVFFIDVFVFGKGEFDDFVCIKVGG